MTESAVKCWLCSQNVDFYEDIREFVLQEVRIRPIETRINTYHIDCYKKFEQSLLNHFKKGDHAT